MIFQVKDHDCMEGDGITAAHLAFTPQKAVRLQY